MKRHSKKTPGARHSKLLGLQREHPEKRAKRSCVLVQIDGLSYLNFNKALLQKNLPFLAKYLRKKRAVKGSWRSMLPTSTGAFQSGLFYGCNDDVPGFFFYDKKNHQRIALNSVAGAVTLEERLKESAAPYTGLLTGGSAYCALFTGGAGQTLLTFARLFHPSLNVATKWSYLFIFILSQFVLFGRVLYYALMEIVVAIYDLIGALFHESNKYLEFRFLAARIATVVMCREIGTLATILDIYRGVGPIYLNHVAYDEHAHHRGPSSKFAHWTLKGIDASIERVARAIERAERWGIRDYDLYVWSDHGQTDSVPFQELFHQEPTTHFDWLYRSVAEKTAELRAHAAERRNHDRIKRRRVLRGQRAHAPSVMKAGSHNADVVTQMLPGIFARFSNWLLKPAKQAAALQADTNPENAVTGLLVVSTGPVANAYLVEEQEPVPYEAWEAACPLFLDEIAKHSGIGFALVRTKSGGARVGVNGQWPSIDDDAALKQHVPVELLDTITECRASLKRWANMPSAGDLLFFGYRGPGRPTISYSYERGSHSGPSPGELTPFMVVPARTADLWIELSRSSGPQIELQDLHKRLRETYGQEAETDQQPTESEQQQHAS